MENNKRIEKFVYHYVWQVYTLAKNNYNEDTKEDERWQEEGEEIYASRKIGCGIHLRCKFKYPDLAPSSSKRSLYSPSSITLVSVNMHLPI